MKTHFTMRPGGRRKFLIHFQFPMSCRKFLKVYHFSCIMQLFLFFMMKITENSSKLPSIDCISCTISKNSLFNKHENGGGLDFPSCPLELIDHIAHGFPTSSAHNSLQFFLVHIFCIYRIPVTRYIYCQLLEHGLFKNARFFHF